MTPDDLLSRYDRKLRVALTECWSQLQSSTNVAELTRLLQAGDLAGVLATLQRVEPTIYAAVAPILEDAVLESGRYISEVLPAGAVVSPVIVSLTDPATAKFVQEYVGKKVVEISDETVKAISEHVQFAVNQGRPPAATARDIKKLIGLNSVQAEAVRNFTAALNEDPTRALQYELRDKRFDSVLRRGEQLTADQIERMTNQYINGQLRYRSQSIARTEAMTAISVGQDEALRQGIASGAIRTERPDGSKLMGFWIVTKDGRSREAHLAVPGMNPEGVEPGGVFRTPLGPMHYPRDPAGSAANVIRCRCRLRWRWK